MKSIIQFRFTIPIIAIAAFMIFLNSCKKTDFNNNDPKAARAAAIKAVQERYGNVSAGIIFNVNKKADEMFYRNAQGKMVSLYEQQGNKGPILNRPCYTCDNAPTAGDLKLEYTLNYVQRWYKCESTADKSTLTANWTISIPFVPSYFSVFNLPDTWGYLQIIAPGGGSPLTHTSYANVSPYDFTMKYLGPDCFNNKIYEVTYFFENVPDSYFGNGAQISASLSIEGPCSLIGGVATSGSVNAPTQSNDSYLPCNRIDKVWINPPGGGSSYATAAGNYMLCNYPSGFTLIDAHQVEYREVNSSTSFLWSDQTSQVHWGEPVGSSGEAPTINPSTGVSNLIGMTASSGTWLVRYRNVKTSVCDVIYGIGNPPPPNGDWGSLFTWVTEVWVLP